MLIPILLSSFAGLTSDLAPRGVYVEARTAAVYAGACHYGAQSTTQGRAALAGWRIEAGSHLGVDLAGVELAVAVAADLNLVAEGVERRSVVYLDAQADEGTRRAALAWLRAVHPAVVGTVLEVKTVAIAVSVHEETFRLAVGEEILLEGAAMPERECCKMPYNVWYQPLAPVAEPLVGCPTAFRFADERLGRRWDRPDENNAFFGRFGAREPLPAH